MIEIEHILDVENHISPFDAIIFDLDDTLYSETEYVRSGYQKIADYFAVPEIEQELWSVFQAGGQAIDEVLKKHDLFEHKEEALHIYRFQTPKISLYSGVADMLKRIHMTKKIGIITDGRPEGQNAKLKALELGAFVDEVIITDELGGVEFRKPNKKAFELMSSALNIAFHKMCYVGDNIRKDFIAPNELGMGCIWFRNQEGLY